jgi:cysteine desulfurase / selenocysteine lyase
MDSLKRELIKSEFSHIDTIYFNTAYFGPSPYRAKQKVSRALQKELDPSFYSYDSWSGVAERVREQLAELLNCSTNNITHSTSASDIMNIVANGYSFSEGDVVCAVNRDYPSNILPWMLAEKSRPFKFKMLELGDEVIPTAKWLAKVVPKETKIFNCSHVAFETGKKISITDIGKFCKERDILFVLDTTQSLGGLPITKEELSYIDVLACSSYKWILGPYGHAFAYFSERAMKLVENHSANWIKASSNRDLGNLLNYSLETNPGARKYDRGQTSNFLINACLEAGLEIFKEIGLHEIEIYNAKIRDHFLQNYPKKKFTLITPTEYMANIICLKANSIDAKQLERELKYRNIDVSVRQGNVRLSFNFFNTTQQVDQLIQALDL